MSGGGARRGGNFACFRFGPGSFPVLDPGLRIPWTGAFAGPGVFPVGWLPLNAGLERREAAGLQRPETRLRCVRASAPTLSRQGARTALAALAALTSGVGTQEDARMLVDLLPSQVFKVCFSRVLRGRFGFPRAALAFQLLPVSFGSRPDNYGSTMSF